jgi:hypothetical protein
MNNQLALILSSSHEISLENNDINFTLDGRQVDADQIHIEDLKLRVVLPIGIKKENHQLKITKQVDERIHVYLDDMMIDEVSVPDWTYYIASRFVFSESVHTGSREWHPSGTWYFDFESPIITWMLDEKITQEAQYNQDYLFPWSTKLGPGMAEKLGSNIDATLEYVQKVL